MGYFFYHNVSNVHTTKQTFLIHINIVQGAAFSTHIIGGGGGGSW